MHYWHPLDYSYFTPTPRPSAQDFELDIVSQHPNSVGRKLKKYNIEGISTVGVFEEPFEIHFKNNSYEDTQVKISLDGTDVLTGKPASLEINKDMWVVRAGRTLHLKAWAENSQGGSRFVFTGGDKSVALHTHGDVSHKGIISAAVFTEKNRPAALYARTLREERTKGMVTNSARRKVSMSFNSSPIVGSAGAPQAAPASANAYSDINDFDLRKEAAVGAGEYTEQKTKTVKGLDNPVLNTIVRVRYFWFDELKERLAKLKPSDPHPTGFPGEKIRSFFDLSNVPHIDTGTKKEESSSIARTE